MLSHIRNRNRPIFRWTRDAIFLVSLYGLILPSFAAEAVESEPGPTSIIGTESITQMIWALLVVVLIIVGLSYVLRKLNMVQGNVTGAMKIIGGLALNSKDRLLLVQIGEEQILISASPGRISKVHQLSKPLELKLQQPSDDSGSKFSTLLDMVVKRSR